jgi:2-dehydropantoate 2-reductase
VRILVFGAGATGSLLGHRLADAGHEVTLVGRPGYVRAVQAHGLLLEERDLAPHERAAHPQRERDPASHERAAHPLRERSLALYGRVVYPKAVERIADLPVDQRSWDLILLTVKAYDTQEAAQRLAPHLSQDVPLLIVQNGVGGEELAQQTLQRVVIVSGVLTLSVSVLAPGRIRLETTRGGLSLAPMRKGQDVDHWAELFASAGLKTATYRDYRALRWSKLLLNMQANAIPAILDMTPGEVLADPALFALERSAFLEALDVMRALHLRPVSFPGYPTSLLVWAMQTLPAYLLRPVLRPLFASGRGDKKPSLQIDLARGRRRSEVWFLNGAVVTYAERVGLDVPVNKMLLDTLMAIAAGSVSWDEFRGQPHKLVAAVKGQGE